MANIPARPVPPGEAEVEEQSINGVPSQTHGINAEATNTSLTHTHTSKITHRIIKIRKIYALYAII